MALFPLPETVPIRQESRLRPEQVSAAFRSDPTLDLDPDIDARKETEALYIDNKILAAAGGYAWPFNSTVMAAGYPRFTDEERTDEAVRQLAAATQVDSWRVLASLYFSAGQLDESYREQALEYERRSEAALNALLDRIRAAVSDSGVVDVTDRTVFCAQQLGATRVYADSIGALSETDLIP